MQNGPYSCEILNAMFRNICVFLFAVVVTVARAQAKEKVSLAELPKHAIEQSQLTLPGSQPFHLKAKVFESSDRENDSHNAEIEEHWVAPGKWRRTIKTADFSEVLIVNGATTAERITGDYYPNWLRTIVNGIFDPGARLQNVNMSASSDNPMIGGEQVCRRFMFLASNPPVTNKVFSTYCFQDDLIASIGVPGYEISYADYKKFGEKQVARKLGEYIESGTELRADIYVLEALQAPDDSLFKSDQPSIAPLRTILISEATLRGLAVSAPDMHWPTLTSGRNPGTLSIYVCIDRQGHVRETLPLNSDNPIMTAAAREQVLNWQFKPAINQGEPVQVESILTFAYDTKIVPAK